MPQIHSAVGKVPAARFSRVPLDFLEGLVAGDGHDLVGGEANGLTASSVLTPGTTLTIPAKAGKEGAQAAIGAAGVRAASAASATYKRGSPERAFLASELRAVRSSGASRIAEQRGIVFGHREAARLGYEPVLTSL